MKNFEYKLIDQFLESILVEKGLSKNTIDSYRKDLYDAQTFLGKRVELYHLGLNDIKKILNLWSITLSPVSQARKISSLKQFFHWLKSENLIKENIMKTINSPKSNHNLPKILNESEMEKIIEASRDENSKDFPLMYCVVELLYSTGLRVSELVSLPIQGMDKDPKSIIVKGKGGKQRLVVLTEAARKALLLWLHKRHQMKFAIGSKYLFPSESNLYLTRQIIAHKLKNLAIKAGLSPSNVTPHAIRHSFATHMLSRGADLRSLQTLLGHSSISTTQIYTHTANERLLGLVKNVHPLADKVISD